MFEFRAELRNVERVQRRNEYHAVGVAHRQAGHPIGLSADLYGTVDHFVAVKVDRYEFRGEFRGAHVCRYGGDLVAYGIDLQMMDLAAHLDIHLALVDDAGIIEELAYAAERVAAHAARSSVHVVDPGLCVSAVGAEYEDDAVAADAVVSVGQLYRQALGTADLAVEAVEVDVVVPTSLHLGEHQSHLLVTQRVDVHEFYGSGGVSAAQAVCDGVRRIYRRKAGHAALDGLAAHPDAVAVRKTSAGGRGYDVVYLAALDKAEAVVVACMDLADGDRVDARRLESPGCAFRRVDSEAHVCELPRDVRYLGLVPVAHGEEDAAALFEFVARCAEPLVQSFLAGRRYAEDFAGGLHLRPEMGVDVY